MNMQEIGFIGIFLWNSIHIRQTMVLSICLYSKEERTDLWFSITSGAEKYVRLYLGFQGIEWSLQFLYQDADKQMAYGNARQRRLDPSALQEPSRYSIILHWPQFSCFCINQFFAYFHLYIMSFMRFCLLVLYKRFLKHCTLANKVDGQYDESCPNLQCQRRKGTNTCPLWMLIETPSAPCTNGM